MALMFISVLLLRGVKGAIIIGVMIATFISWLPDTRVSYWDDNVEPLGGGAGKGGGEYRFDYFKKVVKVEPMDMTAGKFDFDWAGGKIVEALFIFFFPFLFVFFFLFLFFLHLPHLSKLAVCRGATVQEIS